MTDPAISPVDILKKLNIFRPVKTTLQVFNVRNVPKDFMGMLQLDPRMIVNLARVLCQKTSKTLFITQLSKKQYHMYKMVFCLDQKT